jgi:hypothetical protein
VLHSDDPSVGMDKSDRQSQAVLEGMRGRSITIGWAVAVLLATSAWFYIVARTAWFAVDWFFN